MFTESLRSITERLQETNAADGESLPPQPRISWQKSGKPGDAPDLVGKGEGLKGSRTMCALEVGGDD